MTTTTTKKPRIVVYGAGQYGQFITRFAVQKGWSIVAAYNRAGLKVGQDIGQLAGIGDIGVVVQDCDTASYENLNADVGVVTTTNHLLPNMPAYRRLLSAGMNVICHGVEAYYPRANDPVLAEEIDALAKKNKVTFSGSAIWDMSRIWSGILVTGPCTEIESLFHKSVTDVVRQSNALEQLLPIGTSLTVDEFMARGLDSSPVAVAYKTIPEHVLTAVGYTITSSRGYVEPVVFDEDVEISKFDCVIPAGDCVGSRIIAEIETKEGVTARAEVELRLVKDDEIEFMHWAIEGKPRTRITTERLDSDHTTIACLFNRIPDVIAARAGIVLISEMGPLKHTALL